MTTREWFRRRQNARTKVRMWLAGTVVMVYILLALSSVTLSVVWRGSNPESSTPENDGMVYLMPEGAGNGQNDKGRGDEMMRVRRSAAGGSVSEISQNYSGTTAANDQDSHENCTPRAINNFPDNFFTLKETQDGLVFVHILLSLYLFAALAVVCDDYFVPSLERICDDLGLQEDVAGATFMAAGSSAPELCTSIVGVFIAHSDVGVGTIVGSAVFNILFIIGLCGIFAGMVVDLTWYPLMRDTLFYLLSVLALVLVIDDSRVHWYEGLAMLILYGLYILLMYFNRRLETWAITAVDSLKARWRGKGGPVDPEEKQSLLGGPSTDSHGGGGSIGASGGPEEVETRFGSTGGSQSGEKSGESGDKKYESPWQIPESFLARVYWVAMIPVRALCYLTVPDCRRGGVWRRLYPLTFTMSVVWIGAFTYVMVWMITIAGDALDIPDTVMGLTLLAAGTSLPDCLASVLVARDGYGDMAVSNSIGSNVFDILMCLGLPWLISTAAVQRGGALEIASSGLLYSSLTLLATVVFLLVSICANRWRLTKAYGVLCLLVYAGVISLSSLYELNVFGYFNPPSCPR